MYIFHCYLQRFKKVTHPNIVPNEVSTSPSELFLRDCSAWPGRAAQVARSKFCHDMICHDSTEGPDALRLRTVSRRHWRVTTPARSLSVNQIPRNKP